MNSALLGEALIKVLAVDDERLQNLTYKPMDSKKRLTNLKILLGKIK